MKYQYLNNTVMHCWCISWLIWYMYVHDLLFGLYALLFQNFSFQ
jgi:hypothetical protein